MVAAGSKIYNKGIVHRFVMVFTEKKIFKIITIFNRFFEILRYLILFEKKVNLIFILTRNIGNIGPNDIFIY